MNRASKLYSHSPRMERDEDSGEMGIHRPIEADKQDMGLSGNPIQGTPGEMPIEASQSHERHEMHHKHIEEHHQVHRRHELEHATHKGEKSMLHKQQEKEYSEMHDRHEAEMKTVHKKHESMEMAKGEPKGPSSEDTEDYHNQRPETGPRTEKE